MVRASAVPIAVTNTSFVKFPVIPRLCEPFSHLLIKFDSKEHSPRLVMTLYSSVRDLILFILLALF